MDANTTPTQMDEMEKEADIHAYGATPVPMLCRNQFDDTRRQAWLDGARYGREMKKDCSVELSCEGGIFECKREELLSELSSLKSLVERYEGALKKISNDPKVGCDEIWDRNCVYIARDALNGGSDG